MDGVVVEKTAGANAAPRCRIMRRTFIGLCLGGCSLLVAPGCDRAEVMNEEPPSRPIKMMVVESPAAAVERTFPAVVQAGARSDLSFRVPGTIAEIVAAEGQQFSEGDLLARLDPRDYETNVAEARSTLASAEAELAVVKAGARPEDIALLEAQLAAASARSDQAQADFTRQKQMYEQGLVSRSEYERYDTAREVAGRDVESASQQVAKARTGARQEEIRASETKVETMRVKVQQAEAALGDTQLRAPFDGVVASVYVDTFQEIQAKQAVLSFQNAGGVEVELQVPESLVLRRRAGANVDFEVTLAGDKSRSYSAEFGQYSTEADPVTQTYRLTLRMDAPPDAGVLPGMTAEVRVRADALGGAGLPLRIPVEAVGTEADGGAVVWVVDTATMRVRAQRVETGTLTENSIEILSGLEPGETIATAGVAYLREGMRVRPLGR